MTTDFRGYVTNDPFQAAELYEQRTGHKPTVLIARPDHKLIKDHPLLVISDKGAATMILATHQAVSNMPKTPIVKPLTRKRAKNDRNVVDSAETSFRASCRIGILA